MANRKNTRMGRPPLPEEDRKSERFTVRLTRAEMAALVRKACKAGLSVVEYVRRRVLGQNER